MVLGGQVEDAIFPNPVVGRLLAEGLERRWWFVLVESPFVSVDGVGGSAYPIEEFIFFIARVI